MKFSLSNRGASSITLGLAITFVAMISVNAVSGIGEQIDSIFCRTATTISLTEGVAAGTRIGVLGVALDSRLRPVGRGEQPARVDDPVGLGDRLITGPRGQALVLLDDGSRIAMGASGEMDLDKFLIDGVTQSADPCASDDVSFLSSVREAMFGFVSGEIAARGQDAMAVDTPAFNIGVRGTKVVARGAIEEPNPGAFVLLLPNDPPEGGVGAVFVEPPGVLLDRGFEIFPDPDAPGDIGTLPNPLPIAGDIIALLDSARPPGLPQPSLQGPRISAVRRFDPTQDNTSAYEFTFEIEFSEAVIGVDASDFTITSQPLIPIAVSADDFGVRWRVTFEVFAPEPLIAELALTAAQDITDVVGNPLQPGTPAPNEVYTIEQPLFEFSQVLFNSCGSTGATFAPPFNCSAFGISDVPPPHPVALPASSFLSITSVGRQELVVPQTGEYFFEVVGAAGGGIPFGSGGRPIGLVGTVRLNKFDRVFVVVGQPGQSRPDCGFLNSDGGGGGASIVALVRDSDNSPLVPLFVAAGGGGASFNQAGGDGQFPGGGGSGGRGDGFTQASGGAGWDHNNGGTPPIGPMRDLGAGLHGARVEIDPPTHPGGLNPSFYADGGFGGGGAGGVTECTGSSTAFGGARGGGGGGGYRGGVSGSATTPSQGGVSHVDTSVNIIDIRTRDVPAGVLMELRLP